MRPILFRCFGHAIPSYRTFLTLALVVFGEAMVIQADRRGAPLPPTIAISALLLSVALAGARLQFVVTEWTRYRGRPHRIWIRGESGASLFGGVVGLHVFAVPCATLAGLRVAETMDMLAVAALLGIPVGRVGCLLQGCCPGRRLVWLPPVAEMVVALALVPAVVAVGDVRPGAAFLVGAATYAVFRFGMDFTRSDAMHDRWTLAQRVALAIAIVDTCALALAA